MDNKFHYSSAIHNVPHRKLQERFANIIAACEVCSKLNKQDGMNGICATCNVAIKAAQRYYDANIPVSFCGLTMEKDFIGYQPLMDKYKELVGDLSSAFNKGTSLLVSGLHGVGKSLFATSLLKKAVLKGYTGTYTTLSDAVAGLTGAEYMEQLVVKKQLQMVDMLVIDEFDQRFVSSEKSNDLFARSLENIIRTRLANNLPTIVISNSPNIIETLNGSLKDSLGSLFAMLEKVVVLGEDMRKKDGK